LYSVERVTVIAVGVWEYEHMTGLHGPKHDVERFHELLCLNPATAIVPSNRFFAVLNPTVAELREIVTNYALNRSAANDILVFYFSGHAAPMADGDLALCGRDTQINQAFPAPLATNLIRFGDIVQTVASVKAAPVMILDACYSGQAGSRIGDLELRRMMQTETGSDYALLCSATRFDETPDGIGGGPFSQIVTKVAHRGLNDNEHRRKPFLSLQDLFESIRSEAETLYSGFPQLFVGDTLQPFGFVRNVLFTPQRVSLTSAHRQVLTLLWNNGSPRTVTVSELQRLGSSIHTTYRKLGYKPAWGLIEETSEGARRLSQRGVDFMAGRIVISSAIEKEPITAEWNPAPNARTLHSDDL